MTNEVLVRPAVTADMAAVQAIYAHHVRHGLASFEDDPPSLDEVIRRWRDVVDRDLPYVVAEQGGEILGYAYAGPYRTRPAYRYTLENSVYVREGLQQRGVGRAAMRVVLSECAARGYRQMIAVIGDSANEGSIRLHERLGFARVGLLTAVGFKFGRWVDSVLMQRSLGEGEKSPPLR
ncbi:GNAT family N-acetyltransferase [Desertibaculum subflavum]|uniref:GNAT family N-acetyltransferase n=1 Tax=Desertibaculum subflavum TaxID=2268458 RepID=UPI000E664F8D